jgi:hypothetical protein
MGDNRIRTLGDAWQHAIGNVIAALVFLSSALSCSPAGRRRNGFLPSRGRKATL